jgi:tryptophan synthase beta chain
VSSGLDYPRVDPAHSYLKDSGRAEYDSVMVQEGFRGWRLLYHP